LNDRWQQLLLKHFLTRGTQDPSLSDNNYVQIAVDLGTLACSMDAQKYHDELLLPKGHGLSVSPRTILSMATFDLQNLCKLVLFMYHELDWTEATLFTSSDDKGATLIKLSQYQIASCERAREKSQTVNLNNTNHIINTLQVKEQPLLYIFRELL
jgi:hypothetical protein